MLTEEWFPNWLKAFQVFSKIEWLFDNESLAQKSIISPLQSLAGSSL